MFNPYYLLRLISGPVYLPRDWIYYCLINEKK